MVKQPGVLDLGDRVGLAPHPHDVGVVDLLRRGRDPETDARHPCSDYDAAGGPGDSRGQRTYDSTVSVTADELAALRGGLLGFCYQLLGSPFDAEDAVQDAMERAWRAREAFDPSVASLSTWTFRIARNVCFDRLRESPRRPLPRDLTDPGLAGGAPLVPALDVPWL